MLQPVGGDKEGERIAVGIDPCKEFLQLAILSPGRCVEYRKLPLLPSITEEIVKSRPSQDPDRHRVLWELWAAFDPRAPSEGIRHQGDQSVAHRGKVRKASLGLSPLRILEDELRPIPAKGWAEMI